VVAHNSVMDATAFDPPREPLVIYSFNPFGKKIMQRFVERLVASLRAHPRDCYFIYLNPQCPQCISEAPSNRYQARHARRLSTS
jgi:hypothetical protein